MPELPHQRLADHTTLRLGGPATRFIQATSVEELVAAIDEADQSGTPALILGGGSNLVVPDAGFDGTVIQVVTTGVVSDVDPADTASCSGATVTVAAGETWDDLVARAIEARWIGIEALSGIPGSVGATPIQNVGAYGQDVSQTIASVRTWDRTLRGFRTFAAADCQFGYRHSRFKADPARFVVVEVTFQFRMGDLGAPVAYAELARALGVELGERAPSADVRREVLALRAAKGMVLDPTDHDTWSAGSFFTNPVLTSEQAASLPADAPRWDQLDGTVKTSAAWLIEHAGFAKGYPDAAAPARVSTKHTLALTNRGAATTADLMSLAATITRGVESAFGVRLVMEPVCWSSLSRP